MKKEAGDLSEIIGQDQHPDYQEGLKLQLLLQKEEDYINESYMLTHSFVLH